MVRICEKDEAKYWISSSGSHGFCDVNQVTDSGKEDIETFENEADYLARLNELGIEIEEI